VLGGSRPLKQALTRHGSQAARPKRSQALPDIPGIPACGDHARAFHVPGGGARICGATWLERHTSGNARAQFSRRTALSCQLRSSTFEIQDVTRKIAMPDSEISNKAANMRGIFN
jgi:hypothetical protein